MNYFQTLPPDLIRQTALYSSPEEIFKLSFESEFKDNFTDKFWEDKLQIDNLYFEDSFNTNYDLLLQIKETPYNEYLYIYYRILENIIFNTYKEVNRISKDLISFLNEANADKIKDKLIEERSKDKRQWPKISDELISPNDFDMITRRIPVIYINGLPDSIYYLRKKSQYLEPLFKRLGYIDDKSRDFAIHQIYLTPLTLFSHLY